MSQATLADSVGITFQQIQKYESGENRIGASRLFLIADSLDVPVAFFFDAMPEGLGYQVPYQLPAYSTSPETYGSKHRPDSPEVIALVRAYFRITDPAVRRRILDLMRSMAPPE